MNLKEAFYFMRSHKIFDDLGYGNDIILFIKNSELI